MDLISLFELFDWLRIIYSVKGFFRELRCKEIPFLNLKMRIMDFYFPDGLGPSCDVVIHPFAICTPENAIMHR